MCDFCENLINEDIVLEKENMSFGALGNTELSLEMSECEGMFYLSAIAFLEGTEIYKNAMARISYCPKCGRNLGNENNYS